MSDFALSRVLRPADLDHPRLAPALQIVDTHFTKASPQSEWRRWEYAIAEEAIDLWESEQDGPRLSGLPVDVGGAGSPFHYMLASSAIVVDPHEADGRDLAAYLQSAPKLAPIVTCLSVIEHVEDLDRFLYHLACLTAPGGLLVITTDCWDKGGEDTAHFHWLRERIFTPGQLYWGGRDSVTGRASVYQTFKDLGFDFFGGIDPTYPGPAFYGATGYTFASLVLRKRP